MTDAFTQLKEVAQNTVKTQEDKQAGWIRANRKALMVGAGAAFVLETLVLWLLKVL